MSLTKNKNISFTQVPKFPMVERDLSIIVDKEIPYQALENSITSLNISRLASIKLFDVFENEKLGINKKSLAISFTFSDKERTMTDEETDEIMARIIHVIEKNQNAEIRRNA